MNAGWGFRHTFATVQLALFVLLTVLGNFPSKDESSAGESAAPGWDLRAKRGNSSEAKAINSALNAPAFLAFGWSGALPATNGARLWLIPVGMGVWLQWYGVGLWWDRRSGAVPRPTPRRPHKYEWVGAAVSLLALLSFAAIGVSFFFWWTADSRAFAISAWSIFGATLLVGKMRQWREARDEETKER